MSDAVPPERVDPLTHELTPACDSHRPYRELVTSLMEVWRCSEPEAERRMEAYTLRQCEWIVRDRWRNGR